MTRNHDHTRLLWTTDSIEALKSFFDKFDLANELGEMLQFHASYAFMLLIVSYGYSYAMDKECSVAIKKS
jgi:hypothetical protein